MKAYRLTPHAPLVLRTGKPFGETGGGDSLSFPLPSTVAGALRTACADAKNLAFSRKGIEQEIRSWSVQGPLPAELNTKDGSITPMFPCPVDSRYSGADPIQVDRFTPEETGADEGCDLQDGLLPVFLQSDSKAKPVQGPTFWRYEAMAAWLRGETPTPENLGPMPLPLDLRTHVALDPDTLAARTGQLFQSSGPDFESQRPDGDTGLMPRGWQDKRQLLLARFDQQLPATLLRLGGEARLADVREGDHWPALPKSLAEALDGARQLRLILATPALFTDGWKPGWINNELSGEVPSVPGLRLKLRAAAIDRWQPISGWDIKERCPKAVRRLVPAGSVYWFDILEAPTGWLKSLWLTPICDNKQDRRDGFGLALPGIWKQETTR